MNTETMIVCNSVCESLNLYNEFVELMDKLGELDKTQKVERIVYLKNGEKYRFVSFNQNHMFQGFRGERISSEFFEIIMRIYMDRGNA